MPLYEYRCSRCDHQFEALVRDVPPLVCPQCGSDGLERLMSVFGVATEGTRRAAVRQARKLGEKTRRDEAVAERERLEHHHD
ncbi:MAG: zinc ribbon domain-containing protein [Vicinamibacterales bacterium]